MSNEIWEKATFKSKYAVIYDTTPWWKRTFRKPKLIMVVDFETGETKIKKWWGWKKVK